MNKLPSMIEALMHPRPVPPEQPVNPHFPFVTISRQAGAGAYTVAKALMDELARNLEDPLCQCWRIFGAAMCRQILQESHMRLSFETIRAEQYRPWLEDLGYQLFANQTPSDSAAGRISAHMGSLARRGKVIIIGRGGVCLTSSLPNGIHVRLAAPFPDRVERMQRHLGSTAGQASREVIDRDLARARFVKDQFHRDIDDPELYHCVWNTAAAKPEEIARYLTQMILARRPLPQTPAAVTFSETTI